MEITKTTTHKVVFTVEYFHGTEGGMDNDIYGGAVNDLESAIYLLELAKIAQPDDNWKIVCTVETVVK